MNRILFDASSTNPISEILAVAPGDCILINSWGLTAGQSAQVYRAFVALGSIPEQKSGSCEPPPQVTGAAIQAETPYLPCNVPVELGEEPNQNLTSLVIQQPGFYRIHLTPAALGTAVVEAVVLTGEEACAGAARACCCLPEAWWTGSSLNPCLVITPGGEAGHAPTFDVDACCLLHAFPALPVPLNTDELVVLSGGQCFRSTIAQVFDPAIICTTLGSYLLQLPLIGDTLVVVDAGANCKRVDGETFVEFFETPWTGISITPALTIAPGGINGHGPTFAYDLCADLQAIPACTCEPAPGDEVVIIQGGACVRAVWPVVDLCDQMGLLPAGAVIALDRVLAREAGGACKQVLITDLVTFPLLAPDGSCANPVYSFSSSPSSGMFFDGAAVVVSDDNCTDFIEIGASVTLNAATSFVIVRGGYTAPGANCGLIVETNGVERLRIGSQGAWNLNTLGGGLAGDVITSFGPGAPPQWQAPAAPVVAFPLIAPDGSCAAPSYSFTSSPDSGMFYDPAGVGSVVIGDDNCADFISIGASITIQTAASNITVQAGAQANVFGQDVQIIALATDLALHALGTSIVVSAANNVTLRTNTTTRLDIDSAGAWLIGGTAGVAGQAIVSNGPATPPTWQTPSATVRLNEVADANGSATRAHGTNVITWGWSTLPLASGPFFHITDSGTGLGAAPTLMTVSTTSVALANVTPFRVEWTGGGSFATGGGASGGNLWRGRNTDGQEITIRSGDGPAGFNGGGLNLRAGDATGGNTGGGVGVTAGTGLQGSGVAVLGGDSTGSGTQGGTNTIIGGRNTHGAGTARGGDIDVQGGNTVFLPGTKVGNIFLNSLLSGAIDPTSLSGFVYLPRTTVGAPTGVPSVAPPAGTGVPFIAQILGASVVLHAYDGVAWRSVTLI